MLYLNFLEKKNQEICHKFSDKIFSIHNTPSWNQSLNFYTEPEYLIIIMAMKIKPKKLSHITEILFIICRIKYFVEQAHFVKKSRKNITHKRQKYFNQMI